MKKSAKILVTIVLLAFTTVILSACENDVQSNGNIISTNAQDTQTAQNVQQAPAGNGGHSLQSANQSSSQSDDVATNPADTGSGGHSLQNANQ